MSNVYSLCGVGIYCGFDVCFAFYKCSLCKNIICCIRLVDTTNYILGIMCDCLKENEQKSRILDVGMDANSGNIIFNYIDDNNDNKECVISNVVITEKNE